MKIGVAVIIVGIIMIITGAVLFYSIPNDRGLEQIFQLTKHGGTFAGLMGIGVIMAGILLYLIDREQPAIQEDFDV